MSPFSRAADLPLIQIPLIAFRHYCIPVNVRLFFVKNHDVYLVGTVITRSQALRYLPVNTHNKWYSYICFQAACELLFGKTSCYVTMTKDFGISSTMKKTKNKDLFLIKVREPLMSGN